MEINHVPYHAFGHQPLVRKPIYLSLIKLYSKSKVKNYPQEYSRSSPGSKSKRRWKEKLYLVSLCSAHSIMDFHTVRRMHKEDFENNEEIKELFKYEIFQKLSILNFLRKSSQQYHRDDQRNVSTNFGCVILCFRIKDIKQSRLGRSYSDIILTWKM